jgi:hypothetical protein
VTPELVADVVFVESSLLPTAGATNIQSYGTYVQADLTRAGLEFIMDDSTLKSVQVVGPAVPKEGSTGGGGGNGGGGGSAQESSFLSGPIPWIFGGLVVGGVALQLAARSGKRKMAKASQNGGRMAGGARANPDGTVTVEYIDDPDAFDGRLTAEGYTDTLMRTVDEFNGEVVQNTTTSDGTRKFEIEFDGPDADEERFREVVKDQLGDMGLAGNYKVDGEPHHDYRFTLDPNEYQMRGSDDTETVTVEYIDDPDAFDGRLTAEGYTDTLMRTVDEFGGEVVEDTTTSDGTRMFEIEFGPGAKGERFKEVVKDQLGDMGLAGNYKVDGEPHHDYEFTLDPNEYKRSNPEDGGSNKGNSAEFWVARATVDQDDLDRGNVHRTSATGNLPSMDMEDQRRVASNLAVAPSGKVTVYRNSAEEGLQEQSTYTWRPDDGFTEG